LNQTGHSFEASLYHPDFGDEPVGGRLVVSARCLQFQSETVSIEIPLENVEVEFEERGPGIFFCDPARPEVKIFTVAAGVLRHPAIKSRPQIADLLGRREANRAIRLTLYFLGGCVLVTWLGSLAISAMVRAVVDRVPVSWEEKIGTGQMAELQAGGTLVDDTNNVAQLAALAAPLIQVLPSDRRDLKFHIVEDLDPNACALPGGHVVVNTGLLKMVDRPEELLGVLAHELAHQTQRHVIRKTVAATGPLVIFGVFLHSHSGVGNALALGSGLMVFQGFSQEYETEADDVGWSYLVAANINPRGMIDAFRKLQVSENPALRSAMPQAFRSHPAIEKRIARLEKKWNKLGRKSGFLELQPVTWNLR
jgi:beta-barrel assembly-enhancing protease